MNAITEHPQPEKPVSTPAKPEQPTLEDYKSNASGPVTFGLLLIFVAFGGFGLWAAFAPLESAVSAPGMVVVGSERKTVQHLEGGIIKQILVEDGDYVNKGDVLMLLDDTRARAVKEITHGQLVEALGLAARLQAESNQSDKITFPDELLQENDEKAAEIMHDQVELFEARRRSLNGQIDILNQRIAQYHDEISGLKAQQVAREKQIALYQQEINGLEKLVEKGNIAVNFVLEKKREMQQLQGEQGKFKSDVAQATQGIGEAQLNIQQLTKNQREEVVKEMSDTRANIADLRERLVAAQDTLDRTRVIAPYSGVVLGLSTNTVGAVIAPGAQILEIIPQGEELIFEVRVRTTDIDDVALGQKATLRLMAFSYRHTMIIEGEVIEVSADNLTDPKTGELYYAVKIRVPVEQFKLLGDKRLVPGMPVQALIKTGTNTMLGYIMAPLRDAMAKAMIEK
jgi:epimerase transport system membrane fusion protein